MKAVKGSAKYQGVTVGGVKYVYLVDADEVSAFKKEKKGLLVFSGANCKSMLLLLSLLLLLLLLLFTCFHVSCSRGERHHAHDAAGEQKVRVIEKK